MHVSTLFFALEKICNSVSITLELPYNTSVLSVPEIEATKRSTSLLLWKI
jgi:hypothetical protein